jgi:hypothetical protein
MTKQELIAAVNNTNFCSLEHKGIVLSVIFRFEDFCTAAIIAPEGYRRQPGDPQVLFTYKEFMGLAEHGNKRMFRDMCMFKQEIPCEAVSLTKKRVGGFALAE